MVGRFIGAASVVLLLATVFSTPVAAQTASDLVERDATTLQLTGSITFEPDRGGIFGANLSFGKQYWDSIALHFEGFVGWVTPDSDDDGIVFGIDVLPRWYIHRGDQNAFYLDLGPGFQLASTNFPSDSHHNVRLLVGTGWSRAVGSGRRFVLGVRYAHISNAATSAVNAGIDGVQIYGGVQWGL